jgi:hypothetical protein
MLKKIAVAVLLAGVVGWSPSPTAQTFGSNQRCLHGQDEQPADRARRDQAVRVARQINRAEGSASFRGSLPRQYLPLDDARLSMFAIAPAPDGFRLQFYTDGGTYTFSLKDTRDRCGFAIFSDQDTRIYEALPMSANAHVLPADIP